MFYTCSGRIRFCDKSTVDVAQLRSAMDDFMARITGLFLQQKASQIHSYTRHVSGLLSLCQCQNFMTNNQY